jgi:hypothetical protein
MRSPKQSATESKQSYGYETFRGGEPVTVMHHVRAFPYIRIPPHLGRLEGLASIR